MDKVPPALTRKESFRSYQNDVELWSNQTNFKPEKRGSALLDCLRKEAKNAASSLPIAKICCPNGLEWVFDQLEKSYAIDKSPQFDSDFAVFLEYAWDKLVTVEEFYRRFSCEARQNCIARIHCICPESHEAQACQARSQ